MTTFSKAAANKIINECFNALPYISVSFSDVKSKMYNMELAAEKQHRSGRESVKGFSAVQAAKYFTVKHLIDGVEQTYTIDAILDIRTECLYAQAYAKRYNKELQEFFDYVRNSQFGEIDYADLMK